jgi:hypothetical protein
MGLDTESEQKPEGCAESASKDDVNGTGAHGSDSTIRFVEFSDSPTLDHRIGYVICLKSY